MEQEYDFIKQIADPVKIGQKWDDLFVNYMKNERKTKTASSFQIKLRQKEFLFANRLYFRKIKNRFF